MTLPQPIRREMGKRQRQEVTRASALPWLLVVSPRLDPTWATNVFRSKMLNLSPNNSDCPGRVSYVRLCRVSAYSDRYHK